MATVTVEQGQLLGKIAQNFQGGSFYSFQGIPYAKPPVGELRFKAPQPPTPWTGVRDATKEGGECYQRDFIYKKLVGSEDCLFLNVYTPKLPNGNEDETLKPVMVWIHGGGFTAGSSKSDVYGPEFLMCEDIVLVSINYRLGIFGFLSLEDLSLDIPGNAGMKDMVMALQWVKNNIKNFSGDPESITIFGESAGGCAIHHLVLSPLSKGLFQKVIAQSGCSVSRFAIRDRQVDALLETLQMKNASEKELLKKLMTMSTEQLHDITNNENVAFNAYGPVIEKNGPGAFLTQNPYDLITSGNYNHVPLMIGYTSNEGIFMDMLSYPHQLPIPTKFDDYVPKSWFDETGLSQEINDKIYQFYFGKPGAKEDRNSFYICMTDVLFFREINQAVKLQMATSREHLYFYKVSLDTENNVYKRLTGSIVAPGASHLDDVAYLFKSKETPEIKPNSAEEKGIRRMTRLWTNFARFGNPNSERRDSLIAPIWKKVEKNELNYFDIGNELAVGVDPDNERIVFWDEIAAAVSNS